MLVYFSNSNIDTEAEFNKRLDNFKKLKNKFELVVDKYDPLIWLSLCEPYKDEPEKGLRCEICIRQRLERSFLFAKNNNIGILTSTLTVSPFKNSKIIFKNAEKLKGESGTEVNFLNLDFKKKDGFNKTMQVSREFGLYMQDYCGCTYSKNTGSIKK